MGREGEPRLPIATVEYGPEQIQRLEEYYEEAKAHKKNLEGIGQSLKTPIAKESREATMVMDDIIFASPSIIDLLKKGGEIRITGMSKDDNGNRSLMLTSHPPSGAVALLHEQFFSFLDVLWPPQQPQDNDLNNNIRSSLFFNNQAILKPSSQIATAKTSA